MGSSIDRTTSRAGAVRGRRTVLGAGLALVLMAGIAGASVPFPEAAPERQSLRGTDMELAGSGRRLKEDERGSSAQMQGGSSADRYGGSSADRQGVAGQRDRRVHGKPKRPPKEREPKKPVDGEQQDERFERDQLEPREPRDPR
jgi:hypothetical protein